jgi:hypothetical protein
MNRTTKPMNGIHTDSLFPAVNIPANNPQIITPCKNKNTKGATMIVPNLVVP